MSRIWGSTRDPGLRPKWHPIPYIVHHFRPKPYGARSKLVDYIGYRILLWIHPWTGCINVFPWPPRSFLRQAEFLTFPDSTLCRLEWSVFLRHASGTDWGIDSGLIHREGPQEGTGPRLAFNRPQCTSPGGCKTCWPAGGWGGQLRVGEGRSDLLARGGSSVKALTWAKLDIC
jgi:hypothetical protein